MSCSLCRYWHPEPWELFPEQSDAFCTVEMGRTDADYHCPFYEDKTVRRNPADPEEIWGSVKGPEGKDD